MNTRTLTWLTLLGFVALYLLGIGIRRSMVAEQYTEFRGEVPFTLESALQYRMTRMVYDGEGIPELDNGVEYPGGVNMRKTYSIGAEYVYAAMAHLMPSSMSIPERFRWAALLIFCLGIPALGMYAWGLYRSRAAGLVAALFYAISIASATRSSGIELSRENFALPFFIAFLALDIFADRLGPGRTRITAIVGSAICAAIAMMTWDMIQYGLGLWILVQFIAAGWKEKEANVLASLRSKLTIQLLALLIVGLLNPYLAAHRFVMSPVMGLFAGTVIALWVAARKPAHGSWLLRVFPMLMMGSFLVAGATYSESYGHFGELLRAKIVHMNVKPDDPSLLTYNQRIMWTPALHSANWDLTKQQFPSTLALSLVGAVFFMFPRTGDKDYKLLHPVIYCLVCLGTFILFFRFHVFVIIYMAVIIGGWAAYGFRSQSWRFYAVAIAVMIGFGMELFASTVHPKVRMNKRQYDYQNALVDWLEEHAEGRPVLANFGISGPILAYAGNPVVLHPKFETNEIRERVREYGEALFKNSEEALKRWADQFGVEYLVFSPGEFYPDFINLQMRYMVDAVEPSPDAAAYKLMQKWQEEYFFVREGRKRSLPREHLRYFQYRWHSDKYIVFKMITADDEQMAAEQAALAKTHLTHGALDEARKWSLKALQHDYLHAEASWVLDKALSLKRQGFQSAVPQ